MTEEEIEKRIASLKVVLRSMENNISRYKNELATLTRVLKASKVRTNKA